MSSEPTEVAALGPVIQRYQAVVDDFDRETARLLRVNTTDQRCLEALVDAGEGGLTPREIAERLALTTGSVTTMLDRLERAGYVLRSKHPQDGRMLIVTLTATANTRIWQLIGPHIAESAEAVARELSPGDLDAVRRFLTLVTEIQDRHVRILRATAVD